jgi:cytochrome P450
MLAAGFGNIMAEAGLNDPDGSHHFVVDAAEGVPVNLARHGERLPLLSLLREARRNILSVWPQAAYERDCFGFKLMRQRYLVCNSADTVRRVFLEKHDNYDRKSPQMRHALEPLLGDGLFVSDGALWQERRRLCAPAFEPELMDHFALVMSEEAERLADHWQSLTPGSPVRMLEEMARLTARIIGRTVFGDDTSDAEALRVVRGFSDYQREVEQIGLADTLGLPALAWLANPLRQRRAGKAAAMVHSVIDHIIERHRKTDDARRFTLLSHLLSYANAAEGDAGGCPVSATAARNEAIVMFMAGHETTANTLAWCWYLLSHSPRAAAKLHHELDEVLGGRAPNLQDLSRLPYTRAVFEEALRLYPPVPILSRQARRNDTLGARNIPKDTIILVVPWLLHRHKAYWEKPDHFIPERFLPDQPRPDKFIYIPFSVGRRVCLGMRFGLIEGILCLATLAQRFSAEVADNHKVAIECRLTLRPHQGLPMRLTPRRAA